MRNFIEQKLNIHVKSDLEKRNELLKADNNTLRANIEALQSVIEKQNKDYENLLKATKPK